MVGIVRIAKAGWLSGVNNPNVVLFPLSIAFYLNSVYRCIFWVKRVYTQRHVCLRRRKHVCYTKNKRKYWKIVIRYAMACQLGVTYCSPLVLQKITFPFQDLTQWYNGYSSGDGHMLYNPWSIARALGGNKIDSYWADSGKLRHFLLRHVF